VEAGERLGLRGSSKVLTEDDLEGRTFSPATQDVIAVLDWLVNLVETFDHANGRSKPAVACLSCAGSLQVLPWSVERARRMAA
jgi:hypothetical protein